MLVWSERKPQIDFVTRKDKSLGDTVYSSVPKAFFYLATEGKELKKNLSSGEVRVK